MSVTKISDNHFCNLVRLSLLKYPWVKAVVLFNFLTGTDEVSLNNPFESIFCNCNCIYIFLHSPFLPKAIYCFLNHYLKSAQKDIVNYNFFQNYEYLIIISFVFSLVNSFIQFCLVYRKNAEEAIQALNGTIIGKQTVRLSWGRSPANKHVRLQNLVQLP